MRKLIYGLVDALAVVGALALLVLVGITCTAVYSRYQLNSPIFGIEDLSTMTLSLVVAASIAYGARHQSHVSVDIIQSIAPIWLLKITDILVSLLGAVVLVIGAFALIKKGSCGFDCGAFTPNLEILHQPFYYILAFALVLYAMQLVLQLVASFLGNKT